MVERKNCSFCGGEIEPGTGSSFIRKDGVTYNFCKKKCRKNQIKLGRIPRRTRWTKAFVDMKAAGLSKEARAKPAEGEEPEAVPVKPKATKKPVKAETAAAAPAKAPAQPKPIKAETKPAQAAEPKKKTAYQELKELKPEVLQQKAPEAAGPKLVPKPAPAQAKPAQPKPAAPTAAPAKAPVKPAEAKPAQPKPAVAKPAEGAPKPVKAPVKKPKAEEPK